MTSAARGLLGKVKEPEVQLTHRPNNMVGHPMKPLLGYAPKIPPKFRRPLGFEPNGITGWFDQWVNYEGFSESLFPFKLVDVEPVAWWHDFWYWLGYWVPWDTPVEELRFLKPRPKSERNWVQRRAMDRHFRVGLRYLGLSRWRARVAWKAVRALGQDNYLNGGPEWTRHQ